MYGEEKQDEGLECHKEREGKECREMGLCPHWPEHSLSVSAEMDAETQQPWAQSEDEPSQGPTQTEQQETGLQHGPKVHPEDRARDKHTYSIAKA